MRKCQVFYGWMGMSEMQLKKAIKMGATTIIECASQHPLQQRRLISQEYKRWNAPIKLGSKKIYEKSLRELELANYIKVPSQFVYDSFVAEGVSKKKLLLIPFGVDKDRFFPKEKYEKSGTFKVIFVGSVSLLKGIPYLLEAWEIANLKNAELHIVGSITPETKQVLKKYLNKKVIFHGHTDPVSILKKSDLFVFPSLTEGSALSIMEAMSCGLPCVVTTNSGSYVRDGKDGFIIPIRDAKKMSEKITYFYKNRQKVKEMGLSALKQMEHKSWKSHGNEFANSINTIINNHN